jgi:hypothetical protein
MTKLILAVCAGIGAAGCGGAASGNGNVALVAGVLAFIFTMGL